MKNSHANYDHIYEKFVCSIIHNWSIVFQHKPLHFVHIEFQGIILQDALNDISLMFLCLYGMFLWGGLNVLK